MDNRPTVTIAHCQVLASNLPGTLLFGVDRGMCDPDPEQGEAVYTIHATVTVPPLRWPTIPGIRAWEGALSVLVQEMARERVLLIDASYHAPLFAAIALFHLGQTVQIDLPDRRMVPVFEAAKRWTIPSQEQPYERMLRVRVRGVDRWVDPTNDPIEDLRSMNIWLVNEANKIATTLSIQEGDDRWRHRAEAALSLQRRNARLLEKAIDYRTGVRQPDKQKERLQTFVDGLEELIEPEDWKRYKATIRASRPDLWPPKVPERSGGEEATSLAEIEGDE